MSPSPSARASSSVSCRRVEIAMVFASPLSRLARAIDDPMRPIPISASFSNITLVPFARCAERLQYLHHGAHVLLEPDRNAQPLRNAVAVHLAHQVALRPERLEPRPCRLLILEYRQHEIALAVRHLDRVRPQVAGQPRPPFCIVRAQLRGEL